MRNGVPSAGKARPSPFKDATVVVQLMSRVVGNFSADGFGSLYPRYRGGYPLKFTLGQRREIK